MARMDFFKDKKRVGIMVAAAAVVLLAVLAVVLLRPDNVRLFIDPQQITLEVGQQCSLELTGSDGTSAQWSCDTAGIATVDDSGVVTATAQGSTRITAVVKKGGKEYAASALVHVVAQGQNKVSVSGDRTPEPPDKRGEKFTVESATEGITYDMDQGTMQIPKSLKQSQTVVIQSRNHPYAQAIEFSGSIKRSRLKDTCFVSFGVIDENGKEQWFCLYGKGLSRQRYWDWGKTKYDVDNVYVGFNKASEAFYVRQEAAGNRLNFRVVILDDVMKVYFGNSFEPMSLAWKLPLTSSTFGGFAKGSSYKVALNTVDACDLNITNIYTKYGQDVTDPGGVVGGKYADVKVEGDKFSIADSSVGISYNGKEGTIGVKDIVSQSELFLAASSKEKTSKAWEFTGTVTKEEMKNLFLSFGVRDTTGKEQWFCIYQKGLSRQRYYNWETTKQPVDNVNVFANPASEHFFYKTPSLGGDKLHYKIVIKDDVLKAYFGNDQYDMTLAWLLPLTEELWGGFPAGSEYQLGINTVDPCPISITDVSVKVGDAVSDADYVAQLYDVSRFADAAAMLKQKLDGKAKDQISTVFIGDSFFHEEAYFTSFSDIYAYKEAVCLGYSTTTTQHWVSFVNDWLGDADPRNIVVNLGTNNLTLSPPYNSAANVTEALQELLTLLREKFPNSKIYWYALSPRSDLSREADKQTINAAMKKWCAENGVTCIENPIDDPETDCKDGLHPTAATYEQYAAALEAAGCKIEAVDTGKYQFFVDSATQGVVASPEEGRITVSNGVSKTETMFDAGANESFSTKWQLTGTVTKTEMKNLFLSFGVYDEAGKEQWFCIYGKGLSRQRYWNWENTKYAPDGKYVIANPATEHFYYKTPSLGGDKLHFKLVLEKDVLKAYFGNDKYDMTLAWELPLTEELWGGFAAGSKYRLGINTVDPCAHVYSNVKVLTGSAVPEEEKPDTDSYKFFVDSATNGVTTKPEQGTIDISSSVSQTETMFKASATATYAESWQLTGTVTKKEMKNLFLSFGVYDDTGKEQWFCIYQKGLARQRYWNWDKTKQPIDNKYVFANPASEHFFYKTPSLGGDKLHFKLILEQDVLKAYFGNDQYDMTLAWQLPLTEELWGGFKAGSKYQLGINTVDPCVQSYTNVAVVTGKTVGGGEEPIQNAFYVDTATGGITAAPAEGKLNISNSVSKTETMFKANAANTHAENWQITGTVTKKEIKNMFLSFGLRDQGGKEQWFCIYQKGLARQRYWNWANTKQDIDNVYVFANPASEHFFYKTPSLGGDKLHFKLTVQNDVLKAYFGNDQYDMTLAWQLPLTEELWGGFAAGSKYQLGINTVDPCEMVISDLQITTSAATKVYIPQMTALKPAAAQPQEAVRDEREDV